ncbi:unknown [Sutterella wadsworthensis CAG:135]|nr:unknown [Sutterella wadsworthensis CAG:135]
MRAGLGVAHRIGDFLTAVLRDDAHRDVGEGVAAVANHGRKRCNAVRIHHDGTNLAGRRIVDMCAGSAAHGISTGRETHDARENAGRNDGRLELHYCFLFVWLGGKAGGGLVEILARRLFPHKTKSSLRNCSFRRNADFPRSICRC